MGEPFAGRLVALDEVDEVPGGEHTAQGDPIGVGQLLARLSLGLVGLKILLELFRLHWPAPGAFREALQMLRHHFGRRVIGRGQSLTPGFFGLRQDGAFPFDPVEEHQRVKSVAFVVEQLRERRSRQHGLAAVGEDRARAEPVGVHTADLVGCFHAEAQTCRQIEIHLRFIDLGVVFRGGDIQAEKPDGHPAFSFCRDADGQVRRLAARRADAAGLDTDFVETAMFRTDAFSEPPGGKGRRPIDRVGARVDEAAQGPRDAEAIQYLLLPLPAIGKQLLRGLADFARLDARRGEGAIQHDARRAVITIHVRWRKRQLRPDAFEAVPAGVFVELSLLGGIIAHAQQVIDGVLILLPAQSIM